MSHVRLDGTGSGGSDAGNYHFRPLKWMAAFSKVVSARIIERNVTELLVTKDVSSGSPVSDWRPVFI